MPAWNNNSAARCASTGIRKDCAANSRYRNELTKPRVVSFAAGGKGTNGVVVGLKRTEPRVLLVEDEALVALMMQETLTEFGFQVVGPVGTASEALSAARDSQIDAAVLDINLGDGLVYTVAEILAVRGGHLFSLPVTNPTASTLGSKMYQSCKNRLSVTCCRRSSCWIRQTGPWRANRCRRGRLPNLVADIRPKLSTCRS